MKSDADSIQASSIEEAEALLGDAVAEGGPYTCNSSLLTVRDDEAPVEVEAAKEEEKGEEEEEEEEAKGGADAARPT